MQIVRHRPARSIAVLLMLSALSLVFVKRSDGAHSPLQTSGDYPNRPPGLRNIIHNRGDVEVSGGRAFGNRHFEAWKLDPAAPSTQIAALRDPTNPAGSGSVLRFLYSPSLNPRSGIATAQVFDSTYTELYVMARIFLEETGVWSGTGNKYFYIGADPASRNNARSPTQFYSTREPDGRIRLITQNGRSEVLVNSAASPPLGTLRRPLEIGRWLNIEYHLVAQTDSHVTDGKAYIWVNGELVGYNEAIPWVNQGQRTGFSGMQWYADLNRIGAPSAYRLGELLVAGR